jgi:MFS family permease
MRGLPRTFWILWTGALLNRLGGFVYTFLALYLTQARHFTVAEAGLVVALYGAGSFASGPVGGYLADHLGRRRTMLLSFVLGAAAMLQLGFARAPIHIAASALCLGFCSDLFRPAQHATVADVVAPADRTRAFGYLYWGVNLGFAGAMVLAGLLAAYDFTLLFIGDAATTLIFGIIIFVGVPETHPERHVARRARPDPTVPLRDGALMTFVLSQLLVMLVVAQANSTLAIDMTRHGLSNQRFARLLSINGFMIVLFQPTFIRLVQRFRRARVLAMASLLSGIGFGMNALAHSPGWYALAIVVWTIAELLYSPVTPTVVTDLSPPHLRGSYQGAYLMAWGASSCVGPILGAVVLGRFGPFGLWGACLVLCVVASALHVAAAPARRRRLQALAAGDGLAREDGRGVTPPDQQRSVVASPGS